jgi:spore coat polysaccharide biosynthesis protein SpsF
MGGVIGVIQGRMGSTRLPGKLLAPVAGKPLLAMLVERIRPAAVQEWWLATTSQPEDEVAAAWGESLGLRVHRGDPKDVLSRFVAIVEQRDPDWVVRITADDPFVDAAVVNLLLAQAETAPATVEVIGETVRRLPLGYVPEIARGSAILRAAAADLAPHHRAHVTSWLRETGGAMPFQAPAGWPSRPDWRWTVDTVEDLSMADAAMRAMEPDWATVDYPTMVRMVDQHPEISGLNAAVRQKSVVEG